MMFRGSKLRGGLTAIELLVATSLASLMMVALLGVLSRIAKHQKILRQDHPTEHWKMALEKQIRWDLANTTWIEKRPGQLRLLGYAGRDFLTGESTSRPAEITYTVVRDSVRSWLVRRESHLDELTNRNAQTQLLCSAVTRIEIQRLPLEYELESENQPDTADAIFDGQRGRTPGGLRIMLFHDDSVEPWFRIDVIHR